MEMLSCVRYPTTKVPARKAGASSILRGPVLGLHGKTAHSDARTARARTTGTGPKAGSLSSRPRACEARVATQHVQKSNAKMGGRRTSWGRSGIHWVHRLRSILFNPLELMR